MKWLIYLVFLIFEVKSYLQFPLTKYNNRYAFPILIQNQQYNLILSLDNTHQYITKVSPPKYKRSKKTQYNYQYGIINGRSIEGNTFQGWKRFFSQALFFDKNYFEHQWKVNLTQINMQQQTEQKNMGLIQFTPNIENNKFYLELKKSSGNLFIHDDIFSIYIGPSQQTNRLHIGGYQVKNGMILDNKRFKRVPIISDPDKWIINCSRIMINKSNDKNKWRSFNLETNPTEIFLTLQINALVLKEQVIHQFENLLQTEKITCRVQSNLICQNITDRDLDDHVIQFLVGSSSISFTLRRLLISCDQQRKICTFKVQTGEKYVFGQFFFQQYYTVFNMKQKSLMVAHCNKYPKNWHSAIYLVRFLSVILLFICLIIFILCLPELIDRFKKWKNRRGGMEGIQLISGVQQNNKLFQ